MQEQPPPSSRAEAVLRLEEFAAAQHGYVTRAQAAQTGVDDVLLLRLVRGGYLDRPEHGIYRFRGIQDLRWSDVWIAWLRLSPERDAIERARQATEITRGPTATWVYGVGKLPPEPYQFWTATPRFVRRPDVRLRTGRPPEQDITVHEGLPLTSPDRTVAELVADGHDLDHVADVIHDAVRIQLLDRHDLVAQLAGALRRTLPKRGRSSADQLAEQLAAAAV
jgi:Transcriptional regulator, AbiEi antitoxin